MQPHLKKCFEGIAKLSFTEDRDITEMKSSEGEIVGLTDIISTSSARGQVEKWLLELETIMKKSIRSKIMEAINDFLEKTFENWVTDWPGQTVS